MIDIETLKSEIIERLKPLKPEKIILFGSYAYGIPTENSDLDLYVVTKDDFIPQSFAENMDVKFKVADRLNEIMAVIPTDLIVHTKKMNEKFVELNSYFSRKILNEGVRLL